MKFRKIAAQTACALVVIASMTSAAYCQTATAPATAAAPDNMAVNARDRHAGMPTSADQPNNKVDVELAANVRQAIVNDRSLSMSAHNVKLVAASGVVTLRGPVATTQERTRVGELATRVSGVTRVDNQLDVTNKQ